MADGTDLWAVLLREKWYHPHSDQHLNVKTALSSDRQTPNSSVRPLSGTSHSYSTLAGKKMRLRHINFSFYHLPYKFHPMMTHAQPQGHHVHKELPVWDAGPLGCEPSAGPVGLWDSVAQGFNNSRPIRKNPRQEPTFFQVLQVACTGVVTCSKMAIFCNCKQRWCPCISFLPSLNKSEK